MSDIFDRVDIDIVKRANETWSLPLEFTEDDEVTPIDLTGFTPRVQIRSTETTATFSLEVTVGANLVFDAVNGLVTILNVQLASLAVGEYVWALELDDTTTPRNEEPIGGKFEIVSDTVRDNP